MKKIVFYIQYLGGGGAERVLIDLLNTLSKEAYTSKYNITLFTIGSGVLDSQLNKRVNHIKLIETDFASKKIISKIKKRVIISITKKLKPKFLRWIIDKFLRERFDLEVGFTEGIPIKIVSQSTSKRIGWIHTDLSQLNYCKGYYKNKQEETLIYKSLDETVFVSTQSKEGYENYFDVRLSNGPVIQNLMDCHRIKELSSQKIDLEFKYFCSVGRLSDEKGFDRLIKAYQSLKQSGIINELKLVIIGDGYKKEELQQLVNDLELSEDVLFIPFTENPYKYIKNSEFFISSSRVEGWSLVVAEALLLKRPIVSTRTGAVSIIGENEYGLVVENSFEGIKKGIEEILLDLNHYKHKANIGSLKIEQVNEEKIKEIVTLLDTGYRSRSIK